MKYRPFLFSLIGMLLASCTDGTVFHNYKPLPKEGWERCDTVCFDLPEVKEDISGTLFIGLRTAAHLGYRDIVLAVEQAGEAGEICRCDTIRYALADAEGNALNKGVNYHQYESLHLPFRMKKDHRTTVRIHHLMRHEVMPDITEIGIRLCTP